MSVYEAISLYEFCGLAFAFAVGLVTQNVFLLIFGVIALLKNIPVGLTKRAVTHPRPDGAFNCSLLNQGGKPAPPSNGFPSGHTTFSTFVWGYVAYHTLRHYRDTGIWSMAPLVLTSAFAIAMPIARVQKACHTWTQIAGGVVYGLAWAALFVVVEQSALEGSPRYVADRSRIF